MYGLKGKEDPSHADVFVSDLSVTTYWVSKAFELLNCVNFASYVSSSRWWSQARIQEESCDKLRSAKISQLWWIHTYSYSLSRLVWGWSVIVVVLLWFRIDSFPNPATLLAFTIISSLIVFQFSWLSFLCVNFLQIDLFVIESQHFEETWWKMWIVRAMWWLLLCWVHIGVK